MAYNTNTRLLLKFNNGSGSTATDDTSSYARSATITGGEVSSVAGVFSTNSVVLGDPFGSGSAGDVTVNNVSSLFSTSSNSLKRVDLWFRPEAYPPWGNSPLFSITFQNGDTLVVWYSATAFEVEYNGTATDPSHYLYQSVAFYATQSQWYHLRFAINGDTLKMALDGAETHSITHTTDVWTGVSGNPITEFRLGCWPSAYNNDANSFMRGYIDAVEFLDGDTSWFGGSYTVPSAEPDDYSPGGGPVEIFGTGLNTLEDVLSFGVGEMPTLFGTCLNTLEDFAGDGYGSTMIIIEGAGLATVENVTGTGDGLVLPEILGSGDATLSAVTGSGFGGGPDLNTRLMLHFDIPNSSKDSSLYNRTISLAGSVGTFETGLGKFGDSYFSRGASGEVGSALSVQLGNTLFDTPATSKNIDFFFRLSGYDNYRILFEITFAGGYIISAYVTPFFELQVQVLTPNAGNQFTTVPNAFTGGDFKHINLAFVGSTAYLGLNGTEVWSYTCPSGNVWPQANAVTGFCIGNYATPATGGAALGYFDHFRVREADGWAGGTYTVPSYAWYPGMKVGTGLALLEGATSTGDGIVKSGVEGTGYGEITGVGTTCSGNVAWIGTGLAALDDVYSYGDNFPLWLGQGVATLEATTCLGDGAVWWVFYGTGVSTIEPVTSTGAGGAVTVGVSGAGLASLAGASSISTGTVSVAGASTTLVSDFTGSGSGYTFVGIGSADLSDVIGVATGGVSVSGYGLYQLDSSVGSGVANTNTFALGFAQLDNFYATGSAQNIVSGSGIGWLGDIGTPSWVPDMRHVIFTKQQEYRVYG